MAKRSHRTRRSLLGLTCATVLLAVPTLAQAATRTDGSSATGRPAALKSSLCDKVSAASISAIVGYKVPAGSATVIPVKPSTTNFGISGTSTICTYGTGSTLAELEKDVSLTYEVISKPITTAQMQESIKKTEKLVKYTFAPYTGLGVPGFYFSLSEAGIFGQGITGVVDGTHFFGATVETKSVSKSKLAQLAKLAEKL